MKQTSIDSYREVVESGFVKKSMLKVFETVAFNEPISQRKTCRVAKIALNSGTPRFATLEHNGLIEVVGDGVCEETHKKVALYAITGKIPREKLQKPPSELHKLRNEVKELRDQMITMQKVSYDLKRVVDSQVLIIAQMRENLDYAQVVVDATRAKAA